MGHDFQPWIKCLEDHKKRVDKGNKKYGLWALEERIAKEAGVAV